MYVPHISPQQRCSNGKNVLTSGQNFGILRVEVRDFDLISFDSYLLNLSSKFTKTVIFGRQKPGLSDSE